MNAKNVAIRYRDLHPILFILIIIHKCLERNYAAADDDADAAAAK